MIIGKGREIAEKSVTLVQDGEFKGYGYFKLNHQISKLEMVQSIITPMQHNKDAQHILQSELRRNRRLKILDLPQ